MMGEEFGNNLPNLFIEKKALYAFSERYLRHNCQPGLLM
jgi:hypothetical protein